MKCYCIADPKTKSFLSTDDTWVSFEDGIRNDSIRGYVSDTEGVALLTADLEKFGGESRLHPSPEGETKPLFYEWGS
jgi:hypothetical protein